MAPAHPGSEPNLTEEDLMAKTLVRRQTLLATACLVAAAPVGVAAADVPEQRGGPLSAGPEHAHDLRVMTYNIQHARGLDDVVSVSRIADVIDASGAQVIGLQEVDVHWDARSDFRDQAEELADELDMHIFFAPIYSLDPDNDDTPPGQSEPAEYGTAILSDYPIVDSENHEIMRYARWVFPGADPQPYPGFAGVTINVKGTFVEGVSTHRESGSNGDALDVEIRAEQVEDMLGIIGADPSRTVLTGDLNEDRTWPEEAIEPLFEEFDDVWEVAGQGDGHTAYGPDHD